MLGILVYTRGWGRAPVLIVGGQAWGVESGLPAFSGCRLGMLLNVPQCPGQPPIMELSGSSDSNAEVNPGLERKGRVRTPDT